MTHVIKQTPTFAHDDAARLMQHWYGLDGVPQLLPGERDQNFLVRAVDGTTYVLKIANASEDPEHLAFQNAALSLLAGRVEEFTFPRVCPTRDGNLMAAVRGAADMTHWVRLLTYVAGDCLAHVNPHTAELLGQVGRMVGLIDRALVGFSHPAMHHPLDWDIRHLLDLRPHLVDIEPGRSRELVARVFERFAAWVTPRLDTLRAGVIYNDANDYNVMVNPPDSQRRVVGAIDFGDMVHSAVICDLAVAATYAMFGKPDPIAAAQQVVCGYHAVFPLEEAEVSLLYDLICARLALSVIHAATQLRLAPDNAYLRISEAPAWALLEHLSALDPAWVHFALRHACGWEPCPSGARAARWLVAHADELSPVVEANLTSEPLAVLDLSVASADIETPDDHHDAERFSAAIFARLQAAGARIGVGRYNEARLVYTAAQFATGAPDAERRTIHLGIDLFMAAGSSVFAPLDGLVHSFRDNRLPLDYGPTLILQHTVDGVVFYTLYGHLSRDSLDGLVPGKPVRRGEQIAYIGTHEVNGGWPPHLHLQIIGDMLGQKGDFPGVGTPGQQAVWTSISPDPNLLLRIPDARFGPPAVSATEILQTRSEHLGRSLSVAYQRPLVIVRGFMQHLYDESGRAYLDAVNNVPHVGHCHPRVVRAAQSQVALLNTNSRYLHPLLARYITRLSSLLPPPLSVIFLVNSGSEANELAVRLARTHTGRYDLVVLDHAYHGHTTTLIDISPYKHAGPGGRGAPEYVHVAAMPDPYRGRYRGYGAATGAAYARDVTARLEAAQARGRGVAAFMCESLPGCGGQIVLPDGYLREAYGYIRAAGGVCIADEVQVGFGRVGTHRWGFETQGVTPDIVTLGKPIGNGHPLAAVVTTPDIAASFANGMEYFNTFGGNPVSCAVGLAVLDVIQEEGLQERAQAVGAHLLTRLQGLQARYPIMGDVRGLGLFIGCELVRDREQLTPASDEAGYIVERMKEQGILIGIDGPLHNVLKIKPPLVFGMDDADRLVETLERVLQEDFVRARVVAA